MLVQIAWRNVWRNKGRSGVVIGAMMIGIWALSFGGGFMNSFLTGYIDSSIRHETSNGQIHNPEFTKDQEVRFTLHDPVGLVEQLAKNKSILHMCSRTIVNGMISSAHQATSIRIMGIDPEDESLVTSLNTLISEGTFFTTAATNNVLVGEKLAGKLHIRLRSKVVLTFQDGEGNITAGSFRVGGILHASSIQINESSAYVRRSDLNRLLGLSGSVHEIAFTTHTGTDDEALARQISLEFPADKTEYWGQLSPELLLMQQWMGASLKILIVIIMTALAFGIINTMLMAVLDRIRELGVLIALGMRRTKVFVMIMIETIFLATAGGPLGLLAGGLTITYLSKKGIDLTYYSEGLKAFGYDSILYPSLSAADYFQIVLGVLITALLASIFPAWKASRLNPVEAIHTL